MTPAPDARPPLGRDPLDPARLPSRVEILAEAGSTNAVLASRAKEGAATGTVLVTEHQTSGRGRLDRVWTTPPRSALTFSVLARPELAPARWPWIPLATGYAVHTALVDQVPGIGLKWPNDVLVSTDGVTRKLAGILVERIETPQGPAAVIGIGLNASLTEDERPVDTATSLLIELGQEPDRTALLGDLLARLDEALDLLVDDPTALSRAYADACITLGRQVRVQLPSGESMPGLAVGLDESGRLGVETANGTQWVGAGDVIHVR
ncbi:biotin--[acetyl-CoA-carboxylase] ligase [Nocardioides sp. AE5]|uniref:biotin--[acetyl-CoA-carboxylase] ligase n=1 Tax=Nocardioides sp. AE5 TaxID=2962573 RepID=UPI0028814465|nr:biotin--[acetyl-CoA-carboxylase] ligase [Nocardioides sp. AE5]MDT0201908.1 biotin--[acetyl-CoA-carboxylase] ligase [Nocardioides sp. AE5]